MKHKATVITPLRKRPDAPSGDELRAKKLQERDLEEQDTSFTRNDWKLSTIEFIQRRWQWRGKPVITGLDRVLLEGQACAHAPVRLMGVTPVPYLWYMGSGIICDVGMFVFDLILHYVVGVDDATLCWLVGFGLSIVPRHSTLRWMVFGDYVGGYWYSLGRMYFGFSFSIVLSTAFNYMLTKRWGVSHYIAWLLTLIWTGVVNYFILKKLWSFGTEKGSTDGD